MKRKIHLTGAAHLDPVWLWDWREGFQANKATLKSALDRMMEFPDFKKITVCDVPGLLDGAHRNVGLGHYFLRHIERTKLLIYVIDMAGVDGRKPWEDFQVLRKELEAYMDGLSDRVMLIAANKMDLPESQANLDEFILQADTDLEIFPLSAANDGTIPEFQEKLRRLHEKAELRDLEAKRRRTL